MLLTSAVFAGTLTPDDLRCEYLANPLGIDTTQPRLSWKLLAADAKARGLKQSAYQLLVASSPELLAEGKADLWDSGKVASDETLGIVYSGKPLQSRDRCCWKVRVWDERDQKSDWSAPATWSMGLITAADWQAKWIAAPPIQPVTTTHFGYKSTTTDAPDEVKWVQIDLGESRVIDGIRLWGAWERSWKGDGFPVRFKIEVSDDPKFSAAIMLADQTGKDVPNPGVGPLELPVAAPVSGRYVRLTATKLLGQWTDIWNRKKECREPRPEKRNYKLAFAEIEILSGGKNIALGKKAAALDVQKETGWSVNLLTDGRTEGDAGSVYRHRPPPLFRKDFATAGPIRRATLYATALGCYEASLNGQKIGDQELAPGYQEVLSDVLYQTYDVTPLMKAGLNTVGVVLGDGWYRKRGTRDRLDALRRFPGYRYGENNAGIDSAWFLGQIEIEYEDGRREIVASDETWKCHPDGPWRRTSIYDGVEYDANFEIAGWNRPGLKDTSAWQTPSIRALDDKMPKLTAQMVEPIRVIRELSPVKVTEIRPGVFLYDFGRIVAGMCRVQVDGPKGAAVVIRHAEMLEPDGNPYYENLSGNYNNRDVFTLSGKGAQTFQAKFTYHGFRYAEVSGIKPTAITAIALASDLRQTTTFDSSDPRLNRLCDIVDGAYRNNMFGLLVDVSGRDERMPWMGDIYSTQGQSLSYLYDYVSAGANELQNIIEAADRNKGIPLGRLTDRGPQSVRSAPSYGDAIVVTPYRLWLNYGDRRSLESGYAAAKRLMDIVVQANPDFVLKNLYVSHGWADWMSAYRTIPADATNWTPGGGRTPDEVFDQVWWAYSARLTSEMATALGKPEEAARYREIADKVRDNFLKSQVKPDGTIANDVQSNYALALGMGHLDGDLQAKAFARLLEAITAYKNHLATGTATTIFLLNVLAENGQQELAWNLVMQPSLPSFGVMLDYGATAMWESLDLWHPKMGFNPNCSTSCYNFSQVGFNSVYEWIIGQIAGIKPDFAQPAYKHFFIAPKLGGGLTSMTAAYDSVRGSIKSSYEIKAGMMTLRVTVPPNTTATVTVTLPVASLAGVTESGQPLAKAPGASVLAAAAKTVRLQSGNYEFTIPQELLKERPANDDFQ